MDNLESFERKETLYTILGCSCTTTIEQIRAEYHHKVKTSHPDKNPDSQDTLESFKM